MSIEEDTLTFEDRLAFRRWLEVHGTRSGGIWLLLGKKGGPKTLTANEALEEALCFGWIDGLMRSLDSTRYIKYFARRVEKSVWSEKNRAIATRLIEEQRMAPEGFAAIEKAKASGCWEKGKRPVIGEGELRDFKRLLEPFEPAYTNFLAMPPSVQKTYTGYYLDTKSEKTRQNRLEKIKDRLDQNLKPM